MIKKSTGRWGHAFGAYLQDSHNPGPVVLGTYLPHQVDALHCLEFLSIDKEHRAPGLGVKVMFQREHPGIQGHSAPGIKQTFGAVTETQVRILRVEEDGKGLFFPKGG